MMNEERQKLIDFAEWHYKNIIDRYNITDVGIQEKRGDCLYWFCKESRWIKDHEKLVELFLNETKSA